MKIYFTAVLVVALFFRACGGNPTPPPTHAVLLTWDEKDFVPAFQINRSSAQTGPLKTTSTGLPQVSGHYAFKDNTVQSGITYTYQVCLPPELANPTEQFCSNVVNATIP